MGYASTLTPTQKQNAAILVERMNAAGITNPYTQSAILSIVSKESEFAPHRENLNYSAKRITEVWPKIPASVAAQLANNAEALGNYVYSPTFNPSLGNGVGEGYKYRGAGFNQLTGKANFQKIGNQIGVNLVANPDLMNDVKVASDALIAFYKNGVNSLASQGKLSSYNATNINDFKTLQDSTAAMYHVNTGIGKSVASAAADTTGGRTKALDRVSSLYDFVVNTTNQAIEVVKKKPLITTLVVAGATIAIYLIINSFKQKK